MKQSKTILDILGILGYIIRYIRNLFEHKEEDYYKPVTVGNFWSNYCIKYESNSDRNKTLSVEEYFNKVRPYLKGIINELKKSDTWKIQVAIAISFMSSKNNDEECMIHSESDSVETTISDKAHEVVEELFQSLLSKYQIGLETSMEDNDFIFDHVHLLYYKCHRI